MSQSELYAKCQWLAPVSDDFSLEVARLNSASSGDEWRRIVSSALEAPHLARVAKQIGFTNKEHGTLPRGFEQFNLAVVSNATANHLSGPIAASALRFGLWCNVVETDYDSASTIVHGATETALKNSRVDATLCAVNWQGAGFFSELGNSGVTAAAVTRAISKISDVATKVAEMTGAPVIVQNIAIQPELLYSSFDRNLKGAPRSAIEEINSGIAEFCAAKGHVLFDIEAISNLVGAANWFNVSHWNWAKLPFDPVFIPFYSHRLAALIGAMRGKSRRVAVFDLDNTLWGGVVGDDGLGGLRLGPGSAAGESFLSIQLFGRALRDRGVVLCICSKNDESVALDAIRRHPEMVLKEKDFAAYRINWDDKASNIKQLASTLALGLESFVFIDDNPAERARVRQMLPQVAVPELGDEPAIYPRLILAAGYFETTSFGAEDQQRADYYRKNFERTQIFENLGDYDAYLRSLGMEITFSRFDEVGRKRIVQLINKTNQFNLTTRRYSEQDIAGFEQDPKVITLQVRLKDQFGDNGMISVVICRDHGRDWIIDSWLMSCRVLKRRVEEAVLHEIAQRARKAGAMRIVGEYIATERNGLVADLYRSFGFTEIERRDETQVWVLNLGDSSERDLPFKVVQLDVAAQDFQRPARG